jgi:CheY-like chemotaxis protein/two-component sensor histidine kinase
VIARQSQVLEHLVSDLLEISRIARGEIQLRTQEVTLQEVLADALGNVSDTVAKRRHALDVRSPAAPLVVTGDPVRLLQVVTNLLANAVKYTPAGGHIQVTLMRKGQQAVVRVRDDGAGIRAEDMPHIFDFFYRGKDQQGSRSVADGFGVGLAFARRLVTLHGGRLEGASEGPGKGSEFVVTIPLSRQPGPAADRADPETETRAGVAAAAHRILVVDDNPDVADSFKVLLEIQGHEVRVLNSGRAVVATIGEFCPDVVFLDIGMPEMDGYQVAAAIRAAAPEPRPLLVAMTGYGRESDRTAAMEAGFDRYRLKPLSLGEIQILLAGSG